MNTETHFLSTIGNTIVEVPNELTDFDLYCKPSSNVAYFGINEASNMMYVQFKSGKGYLYTNCDIELLRQAVNAVSIGSFVRQNLSNLPNISYKAVPYSISEGSIDKEL